MIGDRQVEHARAAERITTMADPPQPLDKLREYVKKATEKHAVHTIVDVDEDYESRINKSLHSLQAQVQQHKGALEKVHYLSF